MMPDDATPPLVAASPVPPVVPDSEALSSLPASMLRPDDGAWYDKDDPDDQPSGSGVVPDKPALGLCAVCQHPATGHLIARGCMECDCELDPDEITRPWDNASVVPAVTDDEAAKYLEEKYGKWPYEPVPVVDFPSQGDNAVDPPWYVAGMGIWHDDDGLPLWKAQSYARAAVAALRSAGFLIVHHTKET